MLSSDYLKNVNLIHQEFLKRLNQKTNGILLHSVPLVLEKISQYDESIFKLSFGEIGYNLKSFVDKIDFNHPDITSVFDGILSDDSSFSQECAELLFLTKLAQEHHLNKIIPIIGDTFSKNNLYKTISKKIESSPKICVRILKNPEERQEIRLSKKMQAIDLQSFYDKGEDAWSGHSDSFLKFVRFDTSYKDDIALAKKKVEKYKEIGCISLAEEVQKSIDLFIENIEQSHYGFNRITMTSAAIILAKSLGFVYNSYFDISDYICSASPQFESRIIVKSEFLKEENTNLYFPDTKRDYYIYEPRVYPFHFFADIANNETKVIIDILEKFPEADNKPIFDHFGIIVPSISLPFKNRNHFSFINQDNIFQTVSKEEALLYLDTHLVKNNCIKPIIVGEKDDKCYFISYFNA
jgi:hypothetical protein